MKNTDYFSSCRTWKKSLKNKVGKMCFLYNKSRSKKKSRTHKTRVLIHYSLTQKQIFHLHNESMKFYHQHRMGPPLQGGISQSNHSTDLRISLYKRMGSFCHSRLLHFTGLILPFTKLTREEEIIISARGSL